jgi:hypothetical protein
MRIYTNAILALLALGTAALAAAPAGFAQTDAAAPPAQAAPVPPTRVRGTIKAVSDTSLTLVKKNGQEQTIQLAPHFGVSVLVKASLADIKKNTFVGVTARPDKDGELKAVEVHIFPESMRGAGEGHYPWDLTADSTMTNAAVTDMQKAKAVHGQTLTLTYKGGETKITVPASASIVAVEPGTPADLKAGAKLFAIASAQPDGTLVAGFVIVGRGVSPPM